MRTMIDFVNYLRVNRLKDFATYYLSLINEMDIPLVKIVIKKGMIKSITDEATVTMTIQSLERFLLSLEDGSIVVKTAESLKAWEEDKIPGIRRHEVLPSDLVLIYAAQKKAMFHLLPDFTADVRESIAIVQEVEDYYTSAQDRAVQMLFKIQTTTEEKLTQTEVTRKRLLDIIEASTDFIGFAEIKDMRIMYMNQYGRKMIGIGKDERADQFKVNDVHPDWVNKMLENECIPQAMEKGIWKGESAFLSRTGEEIPVSMILMSHKKAGDGEIEYISTVSRDIRDQKLAEEELKNVNKELARSNAELEQFAYVASHDLQEPLRTISSYVQLIAERYKNKLDADANDFIDFAVDGSHRMRMLINSLLEYSRVNKVNSFEWINPEYVIKDILQDMDDKVKETGSVVEFNNLPKIYGDRVLIGQLFQNLIANAIKFHDGKKPEIKIRGKKEEGEYVFSVQDNGIGINSEYADKIFVIFQRLNSREKYPGTGIGLSICKKIVERHGGKIWVESEPGMGSTFYFTLKTT